ncbi:MAG: hypothetical protein ABEH77_11335, partial [Halobacteriaceae archaeon]
MTVGPPLVVAEDPLQALLVPPVAVESAEDGLNVGPGEAVEVGDDRVEFVDNAVTNAVPTRDGAGCYALLLDPQGGIRTDFYVY